MEQSCRCYVHLSATDERPNTHFNQSNVVVIIQRIVVWVIVELQNLKDLFGVLRLAQGMEPQNHLPSIWPENDPHR